MKITFNAGNEFHAISVNTGRQDLVDIAERGVGFVSVHSNGLLVVVVGQFVCLQTVHERRSEGRI